MPFEPKNIWAGLILSAIFGAPIGYIIHDSWPAAVPVVDVTPASTIRNVAVGELTKLSVKGDDVAWTCEPEVTDLVAFGDNNGECAISFRTAGRFTVLAAASQDDRVNIVRFTFQVNGEVTPPRPDNTWAAKFRSWGIPNAADAKSLGSSFDGVADAAESKLRQNILITPDDILALTKSSNAKALGPNVDKWQGFFAQLNKELSALAEAGALKTQVDHIRVWREIAEAFNAI